MTDDLELQVLTGALRSAYGKLREIGLAPSACFEALVGHATDVAHACLGIDEWETPHTELGLLEPTRDPDG